MKWDDLMIDQSKDLFWVMICLNGSC